MLLQVAKTSESLSVIDSSSVAGMTSIVLSDIGVGNSMLLNHRGYRI
jgi:hypothetical protein